LKFDEVLTHLFSGIFSKPILDLHCLSTC